MPILHAKELKAAQKAEREARLAADPRPTWDELTKAQKDDMIHQIAIKLGLVKK